MDLSGLTGVVGLVALVWKIIDFLRQAFSLPGSKNAVVTQLAAWIAGLVAVFLYAESQLGETIRVGEITLEDADTPTKIIIGLGIASIASAATDLKRAFDNSDSSKQPPLVGGGE